MFRLLPTRSRLFAAVVLVSSPWTPAFASPFSPAMLDSAIVQCAEEISADSLESYVTTLTDFFTRHTNSDTTSSTVGIGAARRWVHGKFVEIADQGGNLIASYHDFSTKVSGITKAHRNVVGEIPGTAGPGDLRIYLTVAHLDSRNEDVTDSMGFAPGADDAGSGVALIVELARVMSQKSWPMTIRFLAVTGEEQGLIGSRFYATDSDFLDEPIAGMLTSDSMSSIMGVANPDTVFMTDSTLARAFATPPGESPHRQLQRYLKAMGDVYVPIQNILLIPLEDRPGRGGDHQSFIARGFTAIRFIEGLEMLALQHTVNDVLGPHLSMSSLRRNGQVSLATLGALALSPKSPLGLSVGDIGDSTGFRLEWPTTNLEPDLDGYLVSIRTPGALDYETVFDVGMVNEFVVSSPPADSVFFGLSVKNTGGHHALIAEEVLGVLSSVPVAPMGLAADPDPSAVHLSWAPNAEGDLLGYNVFRSDTPGTGYLQLNGAPVLTASYDDDMAVAGTYHYYVATAVDSSSNESVVSDEAVGRLVSLDSGILLVNETKNGFSAWFPSVVASDSVYQSMLSTLSHDTWTVDTQGLPTLSDIGPYSSVIWAADDFNGTFQGSVVTTQLLKDDVVVLTDYMDFGGNVMLTNWEGAKGIRTIIDYPLDLGPGDFLFDYFGLDDVTYKKQSDFAGGVGQSFFASVALEPTRLRSQWEGELIRVEYMTALRPDTDVGFLYESDDPDSAYHHQPCAAYRDGGGYRTVYWGFPLYHLDTADARAALEAAMTYFGELPSTDVAVFGGAVNLALAQSRPNPFRDVTEIRIAIPGDQATIGLRVYDVTGRRVRTLASGIWPGGVHVLAWDGTNDSGRSVAAGVYFYRLQSADRVLTKKLIRLR